MSQAIVELKIPPQVYEHARRIASENNVSLESVLVEGLSLLFTNLAATELHPDDLKHYRDEQLWAVVYQRLAWPQETRLRELMALGKQGALSDDDEAEMERLLDLVDQQMLLRSEALLLLKQRGHDVEAKLKLGA